jgi:hypothetical protein
VKSTEVFDSKSQLKGQFQYLWKWVQDKKSLQNSKNPNSQAQYRTFFSETKGNAALISCLGRGGIDDLLGDTHLYDDLQGSLEKLTKRLAKEGKRPSPRVKEFKIRDAALELHALRTGSMADFASGVTELGGNVRRLSDLFQPAQPEVRVLRELAMGCCNVSVKPNLDVRAPIRALKELTNLDFDFNDVFIARNVILSTSSLSLEETAKLLGVTRQTVWNRKKIIIASFESLAGNESFRALTDLALSFRRFPVNEERYEPEFVLDPWEICLDKSEPLIGFLTITPGGLFPNYIDLLQVVFYLTTKPSGPLANESDPPTGLQLGLGPGVNWDEGNQRYLTGRYQEDEIND